VAIKVAAYTRGVQEAAEVFAHAQDVGLNPTVLDIGGGYTDDTFQDIAAAVRIGVAECFHKSQGLRVLAEPGTLFSCSPFYLAVKVVARRKNATAFGQEPPTRIYINDGIYSNFMMRFIVNMTFTPIAVIRKGTWHGQKAGKGSFNCSVWGRSCDSNDCINRECVLDQEVDIGDWLVFRDMGGKSSTPSVFLQAWFFLRTVKRLQPDGDMAAYTTVCDTIFNVSDISTSKIGLIHPKTSRIGELTPGDIAGVYQSKPHNLPRTPFCRHGGISVQAGKSSGNDWAGYTVFSIKTRLKLVKCPLLARVIYVGIFFDQRSRDQ
jgi:hypothetical protein